MSREGQGGAQRWEPTRGARGGVQAEWCEKLGVRIPLGATNRFYNNLHEFARSKQREWLPK